MEIGATNEITKEVTPEHSAKKFGGAGVDAFGTPALVAFMEEAALSMIDPHLEKGKATVGISMNLKHLAPTPIGDKINIKAVLDEIDGKRLVFSITAYDSNNKIGEAEHERFIIDISKFMTMIQGR